MKILLVFQRMLMERAFFC